MFLILLRISIGWHFLYEGLEKVDSTHKGGKPFTAEPYLRNATGPLAPYFRGLVPDVNGFAMLDPERLNATWTTEVERLAQHYDLTPDQKEKAQALLEKAQADAKIWYQDKAETEKRNKYYRDLRQVQAIERNPGALSFERERAAAKRKDLDPDRKQLLEPIKAIGTRLAEGVANCATPEQRETAGRYTPPKTTLDFVNLSTMWGLVAMGACLILGLFTPLAALAGAVFLGQIYMSMPPWPGLPPNPLAEGHYFIVNKNLVEMLACLVIASTPSGLWIGLDAVLFGKYRRRREAAREEAEAERYAESTSR